MELAVVLALDERGGGWKLAPHPCMVRCPGGRRVRVGGEKVESRLAPRLLLLCCLPGRQAGMAWQAAVASLARASLLPSWADEDWYGSCQDGGLRIFHFGQRIKY